MEKLKEAGSAPAVSRTQQWIVIITLGVLTLFSGLVYAIQGPFYPIEAQSKGVSVAMIAFVYGVYELAGFVASPIAAALMTRIGPVSGLHWGIALTGAATLGLGLISFLAHKTLFIVLSIVFRIIQSVGATFRAIAVISMATFTFQDAVATAMASIESMFGIGMCLGSVVGGALMEVSGFKETFVISGSMLFLILPVSMVILRRLVPNHEVPASGVKMEKNGNVPNGKVELVGARRPITLWTLLREPSIALAVFSVVSAALGIGSIMGVLEPHLKQFNLSPLLIGLMFLYPPLAYVVASPTLGFLYDKIQSPITILLVQYAAPMLFMVAFSIIGPASFVPIEPSTSLTALGLILLGSGISSAFVSSFLIAIRDGKKLGTPADELKVHELVSGIWRAAVSLGLFAGPSVAGLLYDVIGFPNECSLIVGLQIIHVLLITLHGCCCSRAARAR